MLLYRSAVDGLLSVIKEYRVRNREYEVKLALLKFNSREQVAASRMARNQNSRSYWISNFPERNWSEKINETGTSSSTRNVLPNCNEKRCRNSAETSRAISTRVSDLDVEQTDAADVFASIGRLVSYWLTLLTVSIV